MNSWDRCFLVKLTEYQDRERIFQVWRTDRQTHTHTHKSIPQNKTKSKQNRSSGFSPHQHSILIRGISVIYVYSSLREKKVWTFLYLAKVLFKNRDNKHFQTWKSSVISWLLLGKKSDLNSKLSKQRDKGGGKNLIGISEIIYIYYIIIFIIFIK